MKTNMTITEADVQRALEHFRKHGGLIHRLPDEPTPPRNCVASRYGAYENPVAIGIGVEAF